MKKWIIGDTHLGHGNIRKFRERWRLQDPNRKYTPVEAAASHRPVNDFVRMTAEEQHEATFESIARLGKRDMLFCMGDIVFTEEWLQRLTTVRARLILIGGNHDLPLTKIIASGAFDEVYGATKHKGHWMTHIPVPQQELRGRRSVHGHLHYHLMLDPENGMIDPRYVSTCCEYTGFQPIRWEYAISDEYRQECKIKHYHYTAEGKLI